MNMWMRRLRPRLVAPVIVGAALVGCGQLAELRPTTTPLEAGTALSATAGLSHSFVMDRNTPLHVCLAPPPDAVFDEQEGFDFSIISIGGSNDSGGAEEGVTEGEMIGRTPAVLMARELLFRFCEFSRNYQLSTEEALPLYRETLSAIVKVWSMEASNTTVTIGEQLQSTETVTFAQQAPTLPPLPAGAGPTAGAAPDSSESEFEFEFEED